MFPVLLKTIRAKVDVEKTGISISKIRKARNGSVVMEIGGGIELLGR